MTPKRLLLLAIAAAIVVGGGIWLAGRQHGSASVDRALLFAQLKDGVNDVTAIRIYGAGDTLKVEVTRDGTAWKVAQRNGYPADGPQIRKLLLSLADAQLYEQKTANPAQYPTLGVQDLSEKDASGVRVEIAGAKQPVNLIVGKPGFGADAQYVRKVGEPQSWLIDKSLNASAEPQEWLRKDVLDVGADRIHSAHVVANGERGYTATKQSKADANFAVEPLPKGKELNSPSAANSIATALVGLTLADVQPASEWTAEPNARATYKTFDGLVVELRGWERDQKRYVAFSASFDATIADKFKVVAETPKPDAPSATTEVQKPSTEDVSAAASKLSERAAGWVYEIPEYKYDAIFRPLSEMLKP